MNPNDALKAARDALAAAIEQKKANERFLASLGPAVISALNPILQRIEASVSNLKVTVTPNIQVNPKVDVPPIKAPDVYLPAINVPEPRVTVNVPEIKIPEIKMPNIDALINAAGVIKGWDKSLYKHPLPVQIRDAEGNPVSLGSAAAQVISQTSGGGGTNFPREVLDMSGTSPALRVTGSLTVAGSNASSQLIDSSNNAVGTAANPLNVALVSGSSSSTKAQIGNSDGDFSAANPLPVVFSSSASSAAALIDSSGVQYSGSNPLPVTITSGGTATSASNIVDSSGVAYTGSNPIPITMVSSSVSSTKAQIGNSDGDYSNANPLPVVNVGGAAGTSVSLVNSDGSYYNGDNPLPVVFGASATQAVNMVDSSGVAYSGTNPVPVVFGASATQAVNLVDSSGVGYSGSNPLPVTGPIVVSSITASAAASIVDSSGVQYSGSNPLPITWVSGAGNSTVVVGPVASDVADAGAAPIKIGGIARQANPTAVAAGDMVSLTADDLGRPVTRPIQVRDLIKTAYVSVTSGTETTLRAGVAGAFLDCIMITGANNSDAAVSVDIRAVTAGNIVHTMRIPANSTAGWAPAVPWPQDATGNNWTVDGPDETGRTLTFSGLFSQEV